MKVKDKLKILVLLALTISLFSCVSEVRYVGLVSLDDYSGSIVYKKSISNRFNKNNSSYYYEVKTKDTTFHKIKLYKVEWDKFNVGDTIK